MGEGLQHRVRRRQYLIRRQHRDTQLEATDASECSTVFGKECRDAAIAPDELGEFTASIGASPTKACPMAPEDVQDVTAMSKADCTTDFKIDVAALHQAESDRLLAHEQLHFAISHKFAEDLRAELEKTAETLTVSAVACGKPAAVKAAKKAYSKLDAYKVLDKQWRAVEKDRDATQKLYDKETCHGLNSEKQNEWSGKF